MKKGFSIIWFFILMVLLGGTVYFAIKFGDFEGSGGVINSLGAFSTVNVKRDLRNFSIYADDYAENNNSFEGLCGVDKSGTFSSKEIEDIIHYYNNVQKDFSISCYVSPGNNGWVVSIVDIGNFGSLELDKAYTGWCIDSKTRDMVENKYSINSLDDSIITGSKIAESIASKGSCPKMQPDQVINLTP